MKLVIVLVMVHAIRSSTSIGRYPPHMCFKFEIQSYKPNEPVSNSQCKNVFCFNSVQSLNDKVICPGEAKTELAQCGHNEIIDVNSVTIAYVENWNPCTEEYLLPIIRNLPQTCKSNRKLDVAEVYER